KLLSGDPSWRNLTALNFHYETQPLPTWIGWYVHQLPPSAQKFSTALMFGIELAVPFLIFCPRRLRQFGCVLLTAFQVVIFLPRRVTTAITLTQYAGIFRIRVPVPRPMASVEEWLIPLRTFNTYGLFAVMTTSRPEIILEASNDAVTWLPYEFKYKPGDVKR